MPRKKKILPDELQTIVDQVREKEHKEGDKIDVFDPTLSYEITGYRPIDETHGLDFNPEWFTETREVYRKTGKYCPYLKDSKRYNEFWKEQYRRCKYGMTVNGYTITGDNYFFLLLMIIKHPVKELIVTSLYSLHPITCSSITYKWLEYYIDMQL